MRISDPCLRADLGGTSCEWPQRLQLRPRGMSPVSTRNGSKYVKQTYRRSLLFMQARGLRKPSRFAAAHAYSSLQVTSPLENALRRRFIFPRRARISVDRTESWMLRELHGAEGSNGAGPASQKFDSTRALTATTSPRSETPHRHSRYSNNHGAGITVALTLHHGVRAPPFRWRRSRR
jgi:hypothetical protein